MQDIPEDPENEIIEEEVLWAPQEMRNILYQARTIIQNQKLSNDEKIEKLKTLNVKNQDEDKSLFEKAINYIYETGGEGSHPMILIVDAIFSSDLNVIKYLIDCGAKVNYGPGIVPSAIACAIDCNKEDIAIYLKEQGAPISRPSFRETAKYAIVSSNLELFLTCLKVSHSETLNAVKYLSIKSNPAQLMINTTKLLNHFTQIAVEKLEDKAQIEQLDQIKKILQDKINYYSNEIPSYYNHRLSRYQEDRNRLSNQQSFDEDRKLLEQVNTHGSKFSTLVTEYKEEAKKRARLQNSEQTSQVEKLKSRQSSSQTRGV